MSDKDSFSLPVAITNKTDMDMKMYMDPNFELFTVQDLLENFDMNDYKNLSEHPLQLTDENAPFIATYLMNKRGYQDLPIRAKSTYSKTENVLSASSASQSSSDESEFHVVEMEDSDILSEHLSDSVEKIEKEKASSNLENLTDLEREISNVLKVVEEAKIICTPEFGDNSSKDEKDVDATDESAATDETVELKEMVEKKEKEGDVGENDNEKEEKLETVPEPEKRKSMWKDLTEWALFNDMWHMGSEVILPVSIFSFVSYLTLHLASE